MIDDAANLVDGRPIPDLERLHSLKFPRHPRLDAMCLFSEPESRIPWAAVCLNDSYSMLAEARYALLEGFRLVRHYRAKDPPNEATAAFMGQFYGADVSLRLYAAGEHLANAILDLLAIERGALKSDRRGPISLQARVAKFLAKVWPKHPITHSVMHLGESDDWMRTINYRNYWVHKQAPQVAGHGMIFKRREQYWQRVAQEEGVSFEIGIGGGARPDLSVDDLLEFARAASCLFTDVIVTVAEHYVQTLDAYSQPTPIQPE
jgi:hypothetical protein